MNTQVEKIKAETERRMNQFKRAKASPGNTFAEKTMYDARIAMCEETLVFIKLVEEGRI